MSKSTFFTGQPVFNQLLQLIDRRAVQRIAREFLADRYCKSFSTYDHLVTMLYAVLNKCTSLREVSTGLLAWEQRIRHLGITHHPRRSTIADANRRRSPEVFEKIYFSLRQRYRHVLPDSRRKSRKDNMYIFDATTIALFQEILKGAGRSALDGRRKGGIKVHTLLRADQDVPCMIRYSEAAANDGRFLKEIHLPRGSVVVFDKGYRDYKTYNRFTSEGISWVSRHRDHSVYTIIEEQPVNHYQQQQGVIADRRIILGHNLNKKAVKVPCRMVCFTDSQTQKYFEFITNNLQLAPATIANYYRQRWQIETFFKRIKQNFQLQYFLGDNESAIKIQIWCALIADLLLKVIKHGTASSMSYSNMNSLIRLHLMTYINLKDFLRSPETSLLKRIRQQQKQLESPLFSP